VDIDVAGVETLACLAIAGCCTPLTWEDGRRVVFQTLLVMYELDRALSTTGRQA
jgi:hypothetical protein